MRKWIGSLLILATVSVVSVRLVSAESVPAKPVRSLTVQGQGKVSAIPDIATLGVEVSEDSTELEPSLSHVRTRMAKIHDVVKAQGIEDKDIRTDAFQVNPKYEQDKRGNPRRVGYMVTNRISVKVRDLKMTGKVLSLVLGAGATSVNGPDFEIDNPQAVERLALAAATRDAKSKAQAIAEAAGVQLGEIMTINPQGVNWPGPIRPQVMRGMLMQSAAMDVQEPMAPGEQTLSGTVSVTYSIH